jgi:hypothetical protein
MPCRLWLGALAQGFPQGKGGMDNGGRKIMKNSMHLPSDGVPLTCLVAKGYFAGGVTQLSAIQKLGRDY